MKKGILSAILFMSSCFLFFSCARSNGSMAYDKMVVWNGNVYVASDQETEEIGNMLGSIKYYSTDENDSGKDSFSNYYKEGTSFYSILGTNVNQSIAIELPDQKYAVLISEKELNGPISSALE